MQLQIRQLFGAILHDGLFSFFLDSGFVVRLVIQYDSENFEFSPFGSEETLCSRCLFGTATKTMLLVLQRNVSISSIDSVT